MKSTAGWIDAQQTLAHQKGGYIGNVDMHV